MALFGSKDSDLPLLTQFYQLEFSRDSLAGSELDAWLWRVHRAQFPSPPERADPTRFWTQLRTDEHGARRLEWYADLHEVLHRVMPAIVDRRKQSEDDQVKLNELIKTGMEPPEVSWLGGVAPVIEYGGLPHMSRLLSEFLDAAVSGRLTRCEECANIFPRSRKGVRYCSHRCGNRVSMRASRKRTEQKTRSVEEWITSAGKL